jgi:hypothetical protein
MRRGAPVRSLNEESPEKAIFLSQAFDQFIVVGVRAYPEPDYFAYV